MDMGKHNALINGHRGEDGAIAAAPVIQPIDMSRLLSPPRGPVLDLPRNGHDPAPAVPAAAPEPPPETETAGTDRGRLRALKGYPWQLLVIAAPAAVAIWSGWVGLGEKCGFGPIRPLPGITDSFTINTAITLPVGVEAYGAYALAVWLGTRDITARTRQWARNSAIGALALGCLGQIAFHLLSAAGWAQAPWPIVTVVSCLPVVSLALAAALAHMIRADGRSDAEMDIEPDAETAPTATEDEPDPGSGGDTEDIIDDADERQDDDEISDTDAGEEPHDERQDRDTDSDSDERQERRRQRQEAPSASDKVSTILRRSRRLRDLLASDSAADRKAAKEEVAQKAGVSVRTVERTIRETAS